MIFACLLAIGSMCICAPIFALPIGNPNQAQIAIGVPVLLAQQPGLVNRGPAVERHPIEDDEVYVPIGLGVDQFQVEIGDGVEEIDKELEMVVAPEGYELEVEIGEADGVEEIDKELVMVVAPEGYESVEAIDKELEVEIGEADGVEEIDKELVMVVAPEGYESVEAIDKELQVVVQPLEQPDLGMQAAQSNLVYSN